MRSAGWMATLAGLSLLVAARPANAADQTIAVLDLVAADHGAGDAVRVLSDALVMAIGKRPATRAVGVAELRQTLDAKALQQLLGCDDDRCAADHANALAADLLVAGRTGELGGTRYVFLSLIEPRSAQVKARSSQALGSEARPLPAMEQAVAALFDDASAQRGDQALAELKVALLVEERDEAGTALPMRAVEGCIGEQLLAAGSRLVSAAQVARLKKKTSADALLQGNGLDQLDAGDVDLIVAGVVQYAPQVADTSALGVDVHSTRADLQLQLIKVDTGEQLASAQLVGAGPGHSKQMSAMTAAKRLCAKVKPALDTALGRRVERGQQVVIEVEGVRDAAAVKELVAQLEKAAGIHPPRLRSLAAGRAVLEALVPGQDGIGLALTLADGPLGPRIVKASPGALSLRL